MISDPKNLTEQLQNLSERIAIEMRALNRTKVSKINGAIPDNNGEVTIANATTSASGLMSASDKTKLGGIAEGANNYSLPTASSSQLGGVKTGSNITNTSGTISVSKKNVTDALGYTPLQNAPVTSVDGKTGAVDLSATYQPKGNYLTSAPVTSVNGKTGAVTVDVGVTSFNGQSGAVSYSAPVTSVNGKTGAVSIDVGVKTVNNVAPDASGNVTIEVSGGGGSGDAIPKTGNRGVLAGYNTINSLIDPTETVVINGSTNDDTFVGILNGNVSIHFEEGGEETWCKQVIVFNQGGGCSVSVPESGMVLFDNIDGSYTTGMLDLFVYVWYGRIGIVYTKSLM